VVRHLQLLKLLLLFFGAGITIAHEIMEQLEQITRNMLRDLHMPNANGKEPRELTIRVIETSKPLKPIHSLPEIANVITVQKHGAEMGGEAGPIAFVSPETTPYIPPKLIRRSACLGSNATEQSYKAMQNANNGTGK
jgi:hypothetical protein